VKLYLLKIRKGTLAQDGSVDKFTAGPFFPRGENSRSTLNRMLGGPQSRLGGFGKEKYSFAFTLARLVTQ
jgi:hypothetical protein